jgi:hypothetical protein
MPTKAAAKRTEGHFIGPPLSFHDDEILPLAEPARALVSIATEIDTTGG